MTPTGMITNVFDELVYDIFHNPVYDPSASNKHQVPCEEVIATITYFPIMYGTK